ncbi:MAG: hypothetical protein A2W03_07990 [Candidatus Aminicenantes bacterium RBG_16_63_16]|nr:MAG: hypothetical protein A2W03_07990 [Candidatus Aminicenantes bacterium RBG_16_63_16]
MKKIVGFGLAAAAVLLLSNGAAQVTSRRDEPGARTARREDPEARTAAVIANPPSGWTTPVNISNSPAWSGLPMVAADNNGKAYVCWEEWYGNVGAPRAMAFNTNYSGAWGTLDENFLAYVAIDDVGYPVVACDPADGTGYLAYHDGDFANANMEVVFVEYTQGAKTWEGYVSLSPGASDYANLAVDPNSRVVYLMWFDDLTGRDIFELGYRWRDPATKTWSSGSIVPVFLGRSKYWRDMVIDKTGTAHLVFNLRSPTEVFYTKNPTPQNESTWTAPVSVSGNTDRDWAQPRIAVDNAGDVYVVWYANTGGYETATEEVWFRRTVGGVWQSPVNLSNSPGRSEGCVIAVDPESKDVYVAWHELTEAASWEVYLRMFTDQSGGGKAWGDIYNMTNDAAHSAEPSLRMDPQKGLHLVYHDYAGANQEIFYTQKPGIGPPLNIAIDSTLNSAEDQKTNTLTWAANPSNASLSITNYKIYRKKAADPDSAFAQVNQVSGTTFSYADTGLESAGRYAYRLASVTSAGAEGQSATILDKPGVFAPTGVTLTTAANKVLFYEIKDNTITFAAHGFNDPADVAGYSIYRKKAKDEGAAMELVGSTGASVLSYKDAQIKGGQKYAYAVKTKFKDGREGNFSAVVVEK